ncbi:hypothetical protein THF1D04_50271 [Vibrio owensii]|uniref:Uncharacterized protein n=1 Tax=Vibrio owensii TaxID=696485 RepID=A0AAU9QAR5_9VIBR|nr:hypothetical protein THF1D04_50271 [Vibrio owensii]
MAVCLLKLPQSMLRIFIGLMGGSRHPSPLSLLIHTDLRLPSSQRYNHIHSG